MKKFYVFILAISIFLFASISSTSLTEDAAKFQKAVSDKSAVAPANQKSNPQKFVKVFLVGMCYSPVEEVRLCNSKNCLWKNREWIMDLRQNANQNFDNKKYNGHHYLVIVSFMEEINKKRSVDDFKITVSSKNKEIDELTLYTVKKTTIKYLEQLQYSPVRCYHDIVFAYNCPYDNAKECEANCSDFMYTAGRVRNYERMK